MKAFFKDIFEYHRHFNQKLADQLIDNTSIASEKTLHLFSHSINAHQIWNSRILKTESLGVHQVHSLEKCTQIDASNHEDTLSILDDFELGEKVNYQNSKGVAFENSIQEILFHVANHFTHHRGQIVANLRANGIEPLVTDYIFYKR